MIAGIPDEANYCPYCGEEIRAWGTNGKSICEECRAEFYVVEADESKRESVYSAVCLDGSEYADAPTLMPGA